MITSAILIFAATFGFLAFGISIVSLILHWKRPEQSPETARVDADLQAVRTAHLELLDKVEHWMKRDRVRKAREGREKASEAVSDDIPADASPKDIKAALRARLHQINGGKS